VIQILLPYEKKTTRTPCGKMSKCFHTLYMHDFDLCLVSLRMCNISRTVGGYIFDFAKYNFNNLASQLNSA